MLIFVGGIHGVGKTTVCAAVAAELGLIHLTASALIRKQKERLKERDTDLGKTVTDVGRNQDLLVESLRAEYSERPGSYLLDGHFTIPNKVGKLEPVPLATFKNLGPGALIILLDEPSSIAERILKRDGIPVPSEMAEERQTCELNHARAVSKHLELELHELKSDHAVGLRNYLQKRP